MIQRIGLVAALALSITCCFAQESGTNLASGLKRALIFGNQIEMSQRYDNTDAHHKKSAAFLGARDHFNKGDYFFSRGKFPEAFMYYNVGFDIFLSIMNGKEPDSIPVISDKINVYTLSQKEIEKQKKARPMVEKALENGNFSYFGPEEYWEFTRGLDACAMYYQVKGNYERAEVLHLKALSLRGAQFGKTSEPYVASLGNLAALRKDQGDYAAAEDMLNYLVKFYAKAKGTTSAEYLLTMNNKAMLDAKLGRVESALRTLESVIQGNAALPTPGVLDAQRIRTNYALLLAENKRGTEAIALLNDVMRILELGDFDKNADYYSIAIYLGKIFMNEGMYEKSSEVNDVSLKKISNTFGNSHPLYLEAMIAKADQSLQTRNFGEAKNNFALVLPILEQRYGIRNKLYLDVAVKQAYCLWKTNDIASAKTQFQVAMREYLRISDALFTSMSEAEQSQFWSLLKPQLDLFYYFVSENHKQYPDLVGQAYTLRIKTKGLLINNSKKVRERILKSKDPNLIKAYSQWLQKKEALAGYYTMEQEDLIAHGIDLTAFEEQINVLERKLVLGSETLAARDTPAADWMSIQQELVAGEVAVEMLRIKPQTGEDQSVRYMAMILSPGNPPSLVNFEDGVRMETKDITLYKNSIRFKMEDAVTYDRFWSPLLKFVPLNSTVYFSADGVYNSINLNALRNSSGKYLIDDCHLVYLSNTRFLKNYKARLNARAAMEGGALLVGNPEFGNPESVPPLPGTLTEINKIGSILNESGTPVRRLSGVEATKSAFKSSSLPGLVHIATHGFFLKNSDERRGQGNLGALSQSDENPLFKSGLMFAGASGAVKNGSVNVGDAGIMSAYEAMNLDLEHTHLVVLSACETGMGEIVNGEGVYGLIRSFQVAGVEATIMSLWKVDDEATQQLMVNFYQYLSKTGDLASSFRQAQQDLRVKYPEPNFWGAFVLYL